MIKKRNQSLFMSLLQVKKVTPEEVADALGVSDRAVYYWMAGTREPRLTIEQVQALCTLLDCNVHELPSYFGPIKSPEQKPRASSDDQEK
ncbi:helix-turn-helix domain-containing protein [Leptolyngbya sp. AN02str]|uniref:helix-turn-helix domain-containing protein n=1 Tax=Leptolyngbya sp. AN02str TaxID=3423363 RepID=UPI003D3120E2